MLKYIIISISLILSCNLTAQEDYKYRVKIDASPLVYVKNGKETSGKARVRIELEGTEGVAISGKQVEGDIGTIGFRDEPIGKVIMATISIDGVYWSKRIDIENVYISVVDDEDETKKYKFPGGCTITRGNSKVMIDRGGPIDFYADEEAIALEDEADNQIDLDGEFAYNEAEGEGFTISRKKQKSYEKQLKEVITESTDKRICKTETVEASASFDINFLTNPSLTTVYPGALIYAESMADGSYVNIPAKRKPITLSTNIAIIGSPLIEVETPKLSTIRGAMNDLLITQERGDIQIQANFEIKEVHSKEQLSIALGGHFAYGAAEVNFDFSYDSETEETVKVIKFAQKYYTIDMDQPDSPFDVFQNEQDALDVLQSGKTPLYISQVTYGRMAYFFMKTSMSSMQIKAHLDAAYNGGAVEASGYADLDISELLEESEMSALIIGGDASQGITAVDGKEGFLDMLRDGGTLSPSSLGVPVSYIARYLSDSQVARSNLLSTYVKRTCREVASTEENIVVSLSKVGMTEMSEGDSELGYRLRINLLKGDKFVKNVLTKQRTESAQLTFNDTGTKNDMQTEKFDYTVADLDDLWIVVWVRVTEYDPSPDDDDVWEYSEKYLLNDVIGSNSNPIPRVLTTDHDGDTVEFHYSLKSAGN